MIKAAVDFRRVEVFCDERERVELRARAFGIDAPAPVWVGPTGGADANVSERAHPYATLADRSAVNASRICLATVSGSRVEAARIPSASTNLAAEANSDESVCQLPSRLASCLLRAMISGAISLRTIFRRTTVSAHE